MPQKRKPERHKPEWECMDCGIDTYETGEYYLLENTLWRRVNPLVYGVMCLECVEDRLGRRLCGSDFAFSPINSTHAERCPALAERLNRTEVDAAASPYLPREREKIQSRIGEVSQGLLAYVDPDGQLTAAAMRQYMADRRARLGDKT